MGCEYGPLSVSAGGSLQENIAPGSVVCVDQYIDRTSGRSKTYFGSGIVGHLPFCRPGLRDVSSGPVRGGPSHVRPTRFRARHLRLHRRPHVFNPCRKRLFRQWGADCGMTNLPEARLAREAEMSYASAILITDWDCWKERDDVRVDIMKVLRDNAAVGQSLIRNVTASCAKGRLLEVSPQRGAAQFSIGS